MSRYKPRDQRKKAARPIAAPSPSTPVDVTNINGHGTGHGRDRDKASFWISFRPRNVGQQEAVSLFPRADVLCLAGPAGSGKSVAAAALALGEVRAGRARHVTLLRPAVEAGSQRLGFIPGDVDDKLGPHYAAFGQAIAKVADKVPPEVVQWQALNYLRGHTFETEVVVLDEAQNCTLAELTLVLSRLGNGAKLLILGDPEQPDIHDSGLDEFLDRLDGAAGIECVEFTDEDIVRHPRMREWLRRLRK